MAKSFILPKEGESFKALWPCTVSVPVDGGKLENQEIKPIFQLLEQDEIDGFFDDAVAVLAEKSGELSKEFRRFGVQSVLALDENAATAFLKEAIVDIPELKRLDAESKPSAESYDPDILEGLVALPFVRKALLQGYFEFFAGVKVKNSKTSSG